MTGYADPELLISKWLHDLLGIKAYCDPVLDPTWWATAPAAHLQRGVGGTLALSLDDVTLDVDVYSLKADSARKAAAAIWSAMVLQLPLTTFDDGVFCTGVTTLTQPMWAPDPKVFRRTAGYRVILHGFV